MILIGLNFTSVHHAGILFLTYIGLLNPIDVSVLFLALHTTQLKTSVSQAIYIFFVSATSTKLSVAQSHDIQTWGVANCHKESILLGTIEVHYLYLRKYMLNQCSYQQL